MKAWAAWIIINSQKQILLTKRSNYTKSFPHYWTFPWWRADDWESPEQTVVREVKEEVGLDFVPTKLFQHWIIKHDSWNIQTNRFLWTFSWKIQIQESEADWYAWFSYEETKNLKLAFDYREVLEKLHEEDII